MHLLHAQSASPPLPLAPPHRLIDGVLCEPSSCPGPALVSTAAFSAISVTNGAQYAPGLDCSVTVYSPDGLGVSLSITAFSTVADADRTCARVRSGRVFFPSPPTSPHPPF